MSSTADSAVRPYVKQHRGPRGLLPAGPAQRPHGRVFAASRGIYAPSGGWFSVGRKAGPGPLVRGVRTAVEVAETTACLWEDQAAGRRAGPWQRSTGK
jgi:hypothetical protein